jgi:hypothetical protein
MTPSPVTKRLTGVKMAKQRISSVNLSWIISEEFDSGSRYRKSLAVVPDKDGWRIIVGKRHRGLLTAADERRLAHIQRRLRSVYQLRY